MGIDYHVTSLIVQIFPEQMSSVRQSIMGIHNAELSVNNEVKLVVVLEGETQKELMSAIKTINDLPGVLSTTMVYHHCEELEEDEICK